MNNIEALKRTREDIFSRIEDPLWAEVDTRDISSVILLLSSSRGGSTFLAELLKQTNQILSLQGEHVPLYKMHGYSFPANALESDQATCVQSENFSQLSRDFVAEMGVGFSEVPFERYALDAASRLVIQWPQLSISAQEWISYLRRAYRGLLLKGIQWNTGRLFLDLFGLLLKEGHNVNPYYYDISIEQLRESFPHQTFPQGPPSPDFCVEEPPFIVVRMRRPPTVEEFKNKPLLLKASLDAYRVPFLRQIFPNARFKVIHLTRNSAATVNGLYDGWLDRGFFSHNVQSHNLLSITGYSDVYEWGKHWWNFDLPPGWTTVKDHPLEYVCAFQWYSAHLSIIKQLSDNGIEYIRIKWEDIIRSAPDRWTTLRNLMAFLHIEFDWALQHFAQEMPVVMATAIPSHRRWLARKKQIMPAISQDTIAQLAHELGYSSEEDWL
jgi:hypothetical protein